MDRRRRIGVSQIVATMGSREIYRVLSAGAIVPTFGSELLTDPGLEAWTNPTNLTNWSEGTPGASTVNQESVVIHGGTYAARLDIAVGNDSAFISQAVTLADATWTQLQMWLRASAGGKTGRALLGAVAGLVRDPGATYTEYTDSIRATAANPNALFIRASAASASLYFDDVSCKAMVEASLLLFLGNIGRSTGTWTCTPSVVSATQAGIALNYADIDNRVIAYVDLRNNTANLDKYVAGTPTSVISGAITYAAGAELEVTVDDDDYYNLSYNGSAIGSEPIADTLGTSVYGFATNAASTPGTVTTSNTADPEYLLRDEFTTADAAPVTSPRTCEPGPGTLTLVDTGSVASISGSRLVYTDPGGANALYFDAGQYARIAGRCVAFKQEKDVINSFHPTFGWGTDARIEVTGGDSELSFFVNAAALKAFANGSASFEVSGNIVSANADFQSAFVLRSAGVFGLVNTDGNWNLLWVDDASSNANPYACWHARDDGGSIGSVRNFDLPSPWNTDYGIVTDRLAGARSAGDTFTHEADATVDHTVTTLPSAGQTELAFREQDATNYWMVTVDSTGALDLDEVVAGTPTQRGTSAAAVVNGQRVRAIMVDDEIRVFSDNTLKITYSSATNFKTATAGRLITEGTGGAVADIVSYPYTMSGSALSMLQEYT